MPAETLTARDLFAIGQRVRLTDYAYSAGVAVARRHKPPVYGRVHGYSRKPHLIRVVLEGQKTPNAYHVSFWEAPPHE